MGCDIHMVLEKKDKDRDRWVGIHNYPHINIHAYTGGIPDQIMGKAWPRILGRNYDLFAKLAGVRGDGPDPLGVPEDVSDLAAMEIAGWSGDGHSHSYLSLAEFTRRYSTTDGAISDAAIDRLQGNKGRKNRETFCTGGYNFHDYVESFNAEQDARIVFWFDN